MPHTKLEELTSVMMATHRVIRENILSNEKVDPLTLVRMEALRFIKSEKETTMKSVADNLHVTAPSATSLVNSLVKSKFVIRKEKPADRRAVHLALTPKGEKELREAMGFMNQKMKQVFSRLQENDLIN